MSLGSKPTDEMAREVLSWVVAGARIVGGCCGTNLEHYKKVAAVLRDKGGKAKRVRN